MKLSAILAPLIEAKADHDTIMRVVKAFEDQQTDALERRRANDRERQERRRHVKSRDVTVTVPSRTRVEDSSSNLEIAGQKDKKDTSPSARSRGERIPAEFRPDIEWAVSQGLSRDEAIVEASQFIDYWRSKPGKDGLKLDWVGTWRMWVRNALKRRSSQGPPAKRRNYVDVAMDRMNGHGSENIFGDSGDAQRISPKLIESRPRDEDFRGGIAGRFVRSGH